MDNDEIIGKTVEFVKKTLFGTESGHDWWHVHRVWKTSKHIAEKENADMLVVELGALLHDIADSKFHDGDETIGPKKAKDFLESLQIAPDINQHVIQIINNISFKGGNFDQKFKSNELDIVQDADRLDALGAIGIARVFNFGGYKNREIYNPEIKPKLGMTKEEYKNHESSSINHFYEKLLLLKERMNTKTGKFMANNRHNAMEDFLKQFYEEWDGNL